ncbi:MAG: SpoIIE family protein phosphatase [Bacteroidales bacterium]|nr:SpoIIE family protein phosphatase [Bacteroidales bacterium]MBQ5539028.1 SpoIIE family protein phosphatase [Bacteroidales bacterium]
MIISVLLFVFSGIATAQTREPVFEQKAKLLYHIPRYLLWENGSQAQAQMITIGLVNADEELSQSLKKYAKRPYQNGVKVVVREFASVENAVSDKSLSVLFVPYTGDFVSAMNLLKYTPVVIISDNYSDRTEVMIDFSDEKSGLVTFGFNTANLRKEGINVMSDMTRLLHGEDISKDAIIKEQSEQLSEKEEELNQKQRLLDEKEKEIFQKQQQIEIQNRNMAIQSRGIQNQVEKLERQQEEMQILKRQQEKITKELAEAETNLKKRNAEAVAVAHELERQRNEVEAQHEVAKRQLDRINQINEEIKTKESELKQLDLKNQLLNNIILASMMVLVVFLIMLFFIAKLYVGKRRDNQKLVRQNEQIEEQNVEITAQKDEITAQKDKIVESIRYAQKIQQAVMPPQEYFSKYLPDHFIMLKPRDIVSGDFFWGNDIGDKFVFTAADCTGHGVPGAFMSLLGIAFLNDITARMTEDNISAGEILTLLRSDIITYLRQTGRDDEQKDGMDMAVCVYDRKNFKIQYAGAHNPLILIHNGELLQTDADEMPIGYYENQTERFTNHELKVEKGDMLYLFSDGYADQFGMSGGKRRKYMIKNFRDFLMQIHTLDLPVQKQRLEENLDNWRGNLKQLDDVLVMGVRF